jgi:hypothetical protein
MRAMRMAGLCLLLAAVGATLAPAGAIAAPPEFGRCVKVAGHVSIYATATCVSKPRVPNTGAYEWMAGPGPKPGFSGLGESVTLETVGGLKVTCAASQFAGKYATAKTETLTAVSLIGCTEPVEKTNCQSTPTNEGEIVSGEAEGELGYIKNGTFPLVGLDLKAKGGGALWTFTCGKFPTIALADAVEGSAIGTIFPRSKMSEVFKGTFKQAHGKQAVQQFEGGAKDTLTSKVLKGTTATTEETGFASTREDTNEELMEVKAK